MFLYLFWVLFVKFCSCVSGLSFVFFFCNFAIVFLVKVSFVIGRYVLLLPLCSQFWQCVFGLGFVVFGFDIDFCDLP